MIRTMPMDQAMKLLADRGLDTRDGAVQRYADLAAAKWGEGERDAARSGLRGRSHGLVVNAVVHYDIDAIDEELRSAARHLLTDDDVSFLRRGG